MIYPPSSRSRMTVCAAILLTVVLSGCGGGTSNDHPARQDPFAIRPFETEVDGQWIGNAVCYGPHRDGQHPGVTAPSAAQLREDLDLMQPHWNLLRIYGSAGFAETLLSVIREDGRDMKVVLGAWIAVEEKRDEDGSVVERFPEAVAANRHEVAEAIRLTHAYPGIVHAVAVGNETQIYWSGHCSPQDILIEHVRRVRAAVPVPVTVADDFNFWNKPESRALVAEIDFVLMHAHPMWNGLQVEGALAWLQDQVSSIQDLHPNRPVVLGETGWATSVHDQGEQAELIKGMAGEAEQKVFYEAMRKWATDKKFPVFVFEAFDENWKGGEHPAEVEKHWGLFRADRTPKAAMAPVGDNP